MISLDSERPNFIRRYKWAFKPDYATSFELSPVAQPDMQQYLRECDEVLRHVDGSDSRKDRSEDGSSDFEDIETTGLSESDFQYPAECVEFAKSIGEEMLEKNDHGAWAGVWAKDRAEVSDYQ
jgi:hypothetical protein